MNTGGNGQRPSGSKCVVFGLWSSALGWLLLFIAGSQHGQALTSIALLSQGTSMFAIAMCLIGFVRALGARGSWRICLLALVVILAAVIEIALGLFIGVAGKMGSAP
jgi:hypothetical protein